MYIYLCYSVFLVVEKLFHASFLRVWSLCSFIKMSFAIDTPAAHGRMAMNT